MERRASSVVATLVVAAVAFCAGRAFSQEEGKGDDAMGQRRKLHCTRAK